MGLGQKDISVFVWSLFLVYKVRVTATVKVRFKVRIKVRIKVRVIIAIRVRLVLENEKVLLSHLFKAFTESV